MPVDSNVKLTQEQVDAMAKHVGHELEIIEYSDGDYGLECKDCNWIVICLGQWWTEESAYPW